MTPIAEPAPTSAKDLFVYLRSNPLEAKRKPEELAQQFGLDKDVVSRMLEGAAYRGPSAKRDSTAAKQTWQRILGLGKKGLESTYPLVAITSALYLVSRYAAGINHNSTVQVANVILFLTVGALHMASYYRSAKPIYPVVCAMVLWVIGEPLFLLSGAPAKSAVLHVTGRQLLILQAIGLTISLAFYAGLGALCAAWGRYQQIKKAEHAEASMSRQEMLQRYFDLTARLEQATPSVSNSRRKNPFRRSVERNPYLYGFLLGVLSTTMLIVQSRAYNVNALELVSASHAPVSYVYLSMATSLLVFAALSIVCFLSASPWRAAGASLLYSLASVSLTLVPLWGKQLHHVDAAGLGMATLGATMTAGLYMLVGLAGTLPKKAARQRMLDQNDEATLLAELLQLQWRLAESKTNVCVLVVDVAGSSLMKATADPLDAEYSFRAYQEWICRTAAEFRGRVVSTAGDGAVAAFSKCADGLSAALKLQADLEHFNRKENRLKNPFQIRIGLHVGEVVADVVKVQFTEVIDIAAHVEQVCPIGQVAFTSDVAAELSGTDFLKLAVIVDGHEVLVGTRVLAEA